MNNVKNLLERHVLESNAIENIFAGKNHHLFTDHMAAAGLVLKSGGEMGNLLTPEDIHKVLMWRELPKAGEFRTVGVRVGPYRKPGPEQVGKLMEKWKASLKEELEKGPNLTLEQKEKLAWHCHHWFEAIHPFIDGNGRTGRLILNNIRLLLGIPWLIVIFLERESYYDSIRKWEIKHRVLLKIE